MHSTHLKFFSATLFVVVACAAVYFLVVKPAKSPLSPAPTPISVAPIPAPVTTAAVTPHVEFPVVKNPALPHSFFVTDKVVAGAQPRSDAAFKALADMGVKTIISVDGATPDLASAHKYGMHYVHLPITYATVPPKQGQAIAKALDDMPGKIYVHCPQGKARSAAAVAVACKINGSLSADQAESVLYAFGAGATYPGLTKSVREAHRLDPDQLQKMNFEFSETEKIPEMAQAMVEIDHTWENLKLMQKSNWLPPTANPELEAKQEALQLYERFGAYQRSAGVKIEPEDFQAFVVRAQDASLTLFKTLSAQPFDPVAAEGAMTRINASCVACHKVHRD